MQSSRYNKAFNFFLVLGYIDFCWRACMFLSQTYINENLYIPICRRVLLQQEDLSCLLLSILNASYIMSLYSLNGL